MGGKPDSSTEILQAVPPARSAFRINAPRRDLLCALAYVYLACGQNPRALALLRLVERETPDDIGLLRMLAYALLAGGEGPAALEIIQRLESLDPSAQSRAALLLLRSHALRLSGRLEDARECFQNFVAERGRGRDRTTWRVMAPENAGASA